MNKYYDLLKNKSNNKYELITFNGYENKENIIKCNNCNNVFNSTIHEILRKENLENGCPFCEKTIKNPTYEQAIYKLNRIDDFSEYKLKKYAGTFKDKSIFHHNLCDNDIELPISRFISGTRCKYCSHRSFKMSDNEVDQFIKDNADDYIRVGDYKSLDDKLKFKHLICNNEFEMTFHNFKEGSRCPVCWRIYNKSIGENLINKILTNLNVEFEEQFVFKDCKNKRVLKFDFYIKSKNLLIEYDGRQHFIPYKYFGGEEKLKMLKDNDYIKDNYCKLHKIRLLRISYKTPKKDIPNIIKNLINDNQISSTTKNNIELHNILIL